MSVAELTAGPPLVSAERSLHGWGRTTRSRCRVIHPGGVQDVVDALTSRARGDTGVIARGAGRSYGDAAQNDGGEVLDMTGLDRIVSIDRERKLITAQGGATVAQLMHRLACHGLTLPVVPGTRHVTVAGAIASDIHGKNHHRDGGLARYVTTLSLCTPARGLIEVSPETDSELFYATLGGMGLTGVVMQATLAAESLPSPWVAADIDRTDGLEQTLALMSGSERHRYSVAWLDLLAGGSKLGRAIVSRADPVAAGTVAAPRGRRASAGYHAYAYAYPHALTRRPAFEVPRRFPTTLLRPASMRAFNALRWRATPRRERERPLALTPYFFPLDALGEWNRLYGPAGLIQYQFVIPAGEETALEHCFELMRVRRLPIYLAVFKRFGPAFGGPLSFPLEGWTLAIDLPAGASGLSAALEALDELVAGCGGRVYLAKDARLRRDTLRAMYPRLDRFHAQRARVDPDGVLRSDLARRLGLCGGVGE
ncbi:MAG TPA: FAD-binding oxidoreductase [Solirubrobacteraceae bacterium]|jgi:decaprenylphospho-beta-D-ribofuranose 2-oxidase|nr:FAD-binding oxidoreductase [Solirubrobacteraceae bacterium]